MSAPPACERCGMAATWFLCYGRALCEGDWRLWQAHYGRCRAQGRVAPDNGNWEDIFLTWARQPAMAPPLGVA